jgi:hypothetical protein
VGGVGQVPEKMGLYRSGYRPGGLVLGFMDHVPGWRFR